MNITGTGALGTLYFTGGSENLLNLSLNRTSTGTITLGTNLSLENSGVLTLTYGVINTGVNYLEVNNTSTGAAIVGYSSSAYINGNLRRAFFVFSFVPIPGPIAIVSSVSFISEILTHLDLQSPLLQGLASALYLPHILELEH